MHFWRFNVNHLVLTAIFTVMCYNVLCDKYATRQLYGYCPSWALNWQHRRRHIFEEIHHYGADVINLQVSSPTFVFDYDAFSWSRLTLY